MESIFNDYLQAIVHALFTGILGIYLILNLQWYSYRIERVVFRHKKQKWHLLFFVLPLITYYITERYFWIFLIFAYLPLFIGWYAKLDKKLVLTGRVKRFFGFLLIVAAGEQISCFGQCAYYSVLVPLIMALALSMATENLFFRYYRAKAQGKLRSMPDLKIVAITASYGKTSIKNFLHQLIGNDLAAYKTPKSVNTEIGLIADINQNLPEDTQVYIAEAGARQRGDILTITRLLQSDVPPSFLERVRRWPPTIPAG